MQPEHGFLPDDYPDENKSAILYAHDSIRLEVGRGSALQAEQCMKTAATGRKAAVRISKR